MKKQFALLMTVVMMLALSVTAFATGQVLTPDQAKQAALNYAGVKANEATFTKTHRDYEDGREVYEIEFYVGNTEYDMDVDVLTGRITDFSVEVHAGYGCGHDDYDDVYGYDYDDRYDYDPDDVFDWD